MVQQIGYLLQCDAELTLDKPAPAGGGQFSIRTDSEKKKKTTKPLIQLM